MFDRSNLISGFSDLRCQCDGTAGIRTVLRIESVAFDGSRVTLTALDIGVLADFASLTVAVLARSISIIFKGLQHLLDIFLIEDAVRCLAVSKVGCRGYSDIVFAIF